MPASPNMEPLGPVTVKDREFEELLCRAAEVYQTLEQQKTNQTAAAKGSTGA